MHRIFLSLGSNLGDRRENLRKACTMLQRQTGRVFTASSLYETEPWGFVHENYFYNQVLGINSRHDVLVLLASIREIEKSLGRSEKTERYAARIIDIDILFYDSMIMNTKDLQLPHPLIQQRRFVLVPLVEIAPLYIHPVLKMPLREVLEECSDRKSVVRL
jgi:2-amino-4-hydroxy-6-hydroxymethyldihydropteridine diphosphokinase